MEEAIQCHDSSPKIINCTIYNNSSLFFGGGIYCENSSPIILNSILWENGSSVGPNEIYLDQNSSITVTFSDIQDGYQGLGNINENPLFVNPNEPDFHLKPGSPCIDEGTNMDAPIIDMDYLSWPQCLVIRALSLIRLLTEIKKSGGGIFYWQEQISTIIASVFLYNELEKEK